MYTVGDDGIRLYYSILSDYLCIGHFQEIVQLLFYSAVI